MKDTVFFCNDTEFDETFLEIMGLSAKIGEHPIGKFGTGLKIAIAVLLRTGHRVWLHRRGLESVEFTREKAVARGVEYERIRMDEKTLPFTTNLGREWEVWQAYRELRTNVMDENGFLSTERPETMPQTVFEVRGSDMAAVHGKPGTVFLDTEPEVTIDQVEFHPGPGEFVYFRGIRVHELDKPGVKTYNILSGVDLTEDRTAKFFGFDIARKVSAAIAKCDDPMLCFLALGKDENIFERTLSYHDAVDFRLLSDTFRAAAEMASGDLQNHESARKIMEIAKQSRGFQKAKLQPIVRNTLERAERMACRAMGMLPPCEVMVAETLGTNIYGVYKRGESRVWVSLAAVDMGTEFLAATIMEEWMHYLGYEDQSRELQNWLFQRLIQKSKRG